MCSCVLRVPGRQVERLVANFEKFRRLRRRWQNFFSKFRETLGQHPNTRRKWDGRRHACRDERRNERCTWIIPDSWNDMARTYKHRMR